MSSIVQQLRDAHGLVCYGVVGAVVGMHVAGVDMSSLLWISHQHADGSFGVGAHDVHFVLFWMIALTALRLAVQRLFLTPLAWVMGCPPEEYTKFVEMAWQAVYYSSAWCCGFYLTFYGPDAFVFFEGFWENTEGLWRGYPHVLTGPMKLYYLMQGAFWLHMMFVTVIEKSRKDFGPMMGHHIVTSILIFSSYYCGMFRNGALVLVNQDFADIFLPLAKMLKYCKFETLSTAMFAWFSLAWIPTRHWLFFCPVYGLFVHAPMYITEPFDPSVGNLYHPVWTPAFFATFLGLLQVLLLYWLKLLLEAVYRAITSTSTINDQRSDDEDDAPRKPAATKRKAKKQD